MLSFDTAAMNAYLIGVFAITAIALVLSLGVVTTGIVRNRRVRLGRQQSMRPYYGRLALHH
jgi:hypothetical protein